MLISTHLAEIPSVKSLVKLWAERYTPDVSLLSQNQDPLVYRALVQAASQEGRIVTAAKLHEQVVETHCQFAAIQARNLHEYIPAVMDLSEAKRLTQATFHIYRELLKLYQQQSQITPPIMDKLWAVSGATGSLSAWSIPDIEDLSIAIEPALLELQERYATAKDWCTLGFLTTQLKFSNRLLLDKLDPVEQVLIGPYFKFVEEQVALPWQRVCAAAAKHDLDSPAFILVQQMLPAASDIATTVYNRLVEIFTNHRSRQGGLDNPGIAHSCLRDLNMFQAYLWLCVLAEDLAPVEKELIGLCIMVMERVGVKWELTAKWNQLLMDEIVSRVNPEHKSLLMPYVHGMQQAFYVKRTRLGADS
ncbi:MAG: hypothetical protein ACFE0I_05965 [Elainellaceae cyanobacterium]